MCWTCLEKTGAQTRLFSTVELGILVEEKALLDPQACIHPARGTLYVWKHELKILMSLHFHDKNLKAVHEIATKPYNESNKDYV